MAIVLGIDAAWSAKHPSGVALLDTDSAGAKCLVAAPSYGEFLHAAYVGQVDWSARHVGVEAPVADLLSASKARAGRDVDVVAIDMPIGREPFCARREADQAVARQFGSRWCSTHSPNSTRPGPLGERLTRAFLLHGYSVATATTAPGTERRLLEVYPHPALLALLERDRRVPYKVTRMRNYWPGASANERLSLLLGEWYAIAAALTEQLGPLPFVIPLPEMPQQLRVLKGYEDALDAVVSAWVGVLYLQGRACPLGDGSAAVWCPDSVIRQSLGSARNSRQRLS